MSKPARVARSFSDSSNASRNILRRSRAITQILPPVRVGLFAAPAADRFDRIGIAVRREVLERRALAVLLPINSIGMNGERTTAAAACSRSSAYSIGRSTGVADLESTLQKLLHRRSRSRF